MSMDAGAAAGGTGASSGASNVGSSGGNVGSTGAGSTAQSMPTVTSGSPHAKGSSQAQQPNQSSSAGSNAANQAGTGSVAPELFEVKVNGKVMKMTRDEVLAHASLSHAAQSKFEEANRTRKQVDHIINTAKSNPIQALMDPSLGLTKEQIKDAFEKWYTQEFIEPETLTPEQKKSRDMERELERYRQMEQENNERTQQEQLEKMTVQQRDYFSQQIIDGMEKSGLPKTKFFAQRMAFYMRENLKNGWEAPVDLIVSQVKNERKAMMADLTESADVPQLIEMLGEGLINKIRKYDLEQLRQRRQNRGVDNPSLDGYGNPEQGEKVNYSDVNRRLREMRMGKL